VEAKRFEGRDDWQVVFSLFCVLFGLVSFVASDTANEILRVWRVFRDGLRPDNAMGMALTVVSAAAVLVQSRTFFVDADTADSDSWSISILAARAESRSIFFVRTFCILLLHGVVSGLAGNFLVRKPLLCVADGFLCSWACGGAGVDCFDVS